MKNVFELRTRLTARVSRWAPWVLGLLSSPSQSKESSSVCSEIDRTFGQFRGGPTYLIWQIPFLHFTSILRRHFALFWRLSYRRMIPLVVRSPHSEEYADNTLQLKNSLVREFCQDWLSCISPRKTLLVGLVWILDYFLRQSLILCWPQYSYRIAMLLSSLYLGEEAFFSLKC